MSRPGVPGNLTGGPSGSPGNLSGGMTCHARAAPRNVHLASKEGTKKSYEEFSEPKDVTKAQAMDVYNALSAVREDAPAYLVSTIKEEDTKKAAD